MGWWMYQSWWAWPMAVGMLVFWGAVVWVVAKFLTRSPTTDRDRPSDILARRYAAGEIDEDEYRLGVETLRSA